jgi:hypothetical protein
MNPDTSGIYSKSKDAILANQKEMPATYHWNSPDINDKITTYDPEKSHDNSQEFEKEIFCKSYDPYQDDFITIDAVAYNINNEGLIFRTNRPLEIGDPIFIRAKYLMSLQYDDELYEGVHAQVVWCNRTSNRDHELCYEVGVEYFN